MNHTDRVALQNIEDLSPIVKCTIILMHGFVTNYKVKRSFFEKLGNRPFAEAEHYFNKMLEMLMPECIPVLDIIIEFLR